MPDVVVVEAVRSPLGKRKGGLSATHSMDLLGNVQSALFERSGVDPNEIGQVVGGCVGQAGEQALNISRTALLSAGFPESVPATTVDRQCGSSQQAAHFAAQGVIAGAYDMVIAAGVESMSRVPMGFTTVGRSPYGPSISARYPDGLVGQGISAELISAKWKLDRETLDTFAAESHRRATQAAADGFFDREIIPIDVTTTEGEKITHTVDETVRAATTAEGLSGLKPSFYSEEYSKRFPEINWHITPGNSSPLTDGASGALIMSDTMAAKLGLTPRARFHSFSLAGDDPVFMLTAPIPATRKILERSGLSIDDLDAYEVNEAFAPVPLAWLKHTGADPDKLNVHGGAIALGHPLGASGTKLMATLVHALRTHGKKYGLQTMCEGGGVANVTIVEAL